MAEIIDTLELDIVGPVELTFQKILPQSKFYLTDIRFGFPPWIHLAAKAGQNLVELYLKMSLNLNYTTLSSYHPGIVLVRSACDQVKPIISLITRGEMDHGKKEI